MMIGSRIIAPRHEAANICGTSVISYLAARPSRDPLIAAHQQLTHEWWKRREQFDFFVSQLVLLEARRGDPEAAQRRIDLISMLPRLDPDPRAESLGQRFVEDGAVPPGSDADAAQVAIATVNSMEFLVTWNLRHIAGAFAMARLRAASEAAGYVMPTICTPEQFLGREPAFGSEHDEHA